MDKPEKAHFDYIEQHVDLVVKEAEAFKECIREARGATEGDEMKRLFAKMRKHVSEIHDIWGYLDNDLGDDLGEDDD